MRSSQAFSPYTADSPHLPAVDIHHTVSPICVDIDVAELIQEAVKLENAHSLEEDLDELDDIHIMPECHSPTLAFLPLMATASKRAAESSAAEALDLSILWQHRKRCLVREQQYSQQGHQPSARTMQHIRETASPIYTNLQTEGLPAANGAYLALNIQIPESEREREYSAEDLLAMGFHEIPCEGG